MKEHLKKLPTIARPEEGDKLQLYISAYLKTVASMLIVGTEKAQQPVYFVSHILNGAEKSIPDREVGICRPGVGKKVTTVL